MIVLFDLDSTLVKLEGFDEIARQKDVYAEVSDITRKTMDGDVPFAEAFRTKLHILKPSKMDAEWLTEKCLNEMEADVHKLFEFLRSKNIRIGILSNGLLEVVRSVGEQLGLDKDICIGIKALFDKNGGFVDIDIEDPLSKDNGKAEVISTIKKKYKEKIVFVGDSAGDMKAGETADLFIGYGGVVKREKVVRNAEHFAHNMDEVASIIINNFPEINNRSCTDYVRVTVSA